jgi:hypothetical protein
MGPHMAHHLAGGRGGLRHLLEHIGPGIERWWNDLGRPDLTPAVIERLVEAFDRAEPRPIRQLEAERDALLVALLETLQTTRRRLAEDATEGRRPAKAIRGPREAFEGGSADVPGRVRR